ncbi:MAG: hypothetical protein ACI4SA_04480 [Lachnospiraceae bacterium]
MQMQMTEKDKKLISGLAVFVILVAGGYWGVLPMVKNIIAYNGQIKDAQARQEMNEIKIAQVSLLETDNEKVEEEMAALKETFYPVMTSDQVDKYMTGLILDYRLYAYDLNINMPEGEAVVEPYQYSEKAVSEEMNAAMNTSDQTLDENAGETAFSFTDDISTGIYAVEVTMRVGGDREDLERLIDDLSVTDQKMHLCSYSWDEQRSILYHEDGTYDVDMENTLTMTINLYMCEEQEWK